MNTADINNHERLAIAATVAYDLLHDPYLFDELWHRAAAADPQGALTALTVRNTMNALNPGSGQGFMAGYLMQAAVTEHLRNAEHVKHLFA